MCGGSTDTSGMNEQARTQARLAQEAYTWFTNEAGRTQGQRDALSQSALDTQRQQREIATQALQWAGEDRAFQNETTRPLLRQLTSDAMAYDSPERRQQAADAARADVQQSLDSQLRQNSRTLARSGVAPGSGKSLALMQDASVLGAAQRAGAGTQAVRQVEDGGTARRAQAASLAGGLGGSATGNQALALQAGNSSLNAGAAGLNAATSGAGLMNMGFTSGMQGNQSANNMLGRVASMDAADRASDASTLGTIASIAGMFIASTKDAKEPTGSAPGSKSLAAIRELKADRSWRYKPGMGDGGEHNGPYAEDVRKTLGDKAAPGGKVINLQEIDQHAIAALAILRDRFKALDTTLARMEAA